MATGFAICDCLSICDKEASLFAGYTIQHQIAYLQMHGTSGPVPGLLGVQPLFPNRPGCRRCIDSPRFTVAGLVR